MNKKTMWLVFPFAFVPYATLLFLTCIFTSSSNPNFMWFMIEATKGMGIFILIGLLFAYIFVSFCLCLVAVIIGFKKGYPAYTGAKIIMIIKTVLIPAHIVSFLLGAILFIMIFTFVISILMAIINGTVILMMGLLNIIPMVSAVKQGYTKYKRILWAIILQFIPCADVVASIIFYILLRKKKKELEKIKQEEIING